MKKNNRIFNLLVALVVIIGSISFSGIAFGEEDEILAEQEVKVEIVEEVVVEEIKEEDTSVEETSEEEAAVVVEEVPNQETSEELPGEESMMRLAAPSGNNGNQNETGNLKLHKRIQRSPKHVDAKLGNETFTITLTGPAGPDSTTRTVYINKNNNTGEHGDFEKLPFGTYVIDEILSNVYESFEVREPGNHGKSVGTTVEIDKKNATINLWLINIPNELEPDPTGEITIEKVVKDHEGNILNNDKAKFKFMVSSRDDDGEWDEIDTVYITGNGSATINDLPDGEYKVEEINIPNGYTLEGGSDKVVTLKDTDNKGNVVFTNIKDKPIPPKWNKGKVIVTKLKWGLPQGKFQVRLPENPSGITFVLYDETENEISSSTTNKYGFASFDNLPEGDYILKEEVPEGYNSSLPDEGKQITINKNRLLGIVTVIVNNFKQPLEPEWKGTLIIQKYISYISGEEVDLSGFEFELWKDGSKAADPKETNDWGEATFNNLSAGTYEIRETKSKGYLPKGPFTVELNEETTDDHILSITFENERIPNKDIVVEKTVIGHSNRSGFAFKLYRVTEGGEEFVEEQITNSSGLVVFEDIQYGNYVLYEAHKNGYVMGIGDFGSGNGLEFSHSPTHGNGILEVTNRWIPPVPDPDDDDDDDDRPRPRDRDDDRPIPPAIEIPVVDSEIIIVETTPEAQPEPVIEEVAEEIPEAKPIATLPKTGAASPFIGVGFGTILLGLGMFLKKKKD